VTWRFIWGIITGEMLIFVTGGFRSGRSNYALRRAAELGPPPWLYVTAGEETDEAVRKRIERQRRDKEAIWQTAVMPADIRAILAPDQTDKVGAVVLDGFMSWLSNRMSDTSAAAESALLSELEATSELLYRSRVPVLLVSQELGMGLPPSDPAGRRFLRIATSANQILAGMANHVVMMVSGVPLKVR
jgi:adenosylcobinamide kinase/adenosylcobinamide-phosphate guanylyltransferase